MNWGSAALVCELKMTGETQEVRSDKREPGWTLFEHQSAPIRINQSKSIKILKKKSIYWHKCSKFQKVGPVVAHSSATKELLLELTDTRKPDFVLCQEKNQCNLLCTLGRCQAHWGSLEERGRPSWPTWPPSRLKKAFRLIFRTICTWAWLGRIWRPWWQGQGCPRNRWKGV